MLKRRKGKKFEKALDKINIRLNCSFHRILNATPFELKNNCSYLDPLKSHVDKIKDGKIRTLENIKAGEEERNKSRDQNYLYKLKDKVYVKSTHKGMLNKCYDGPYEVYGVMQNRLFLKIEKKSEWVNIKRIKPFSQEEGEDVVPRTT